MTPKFKKIYIELSDICGLDCSFCPNEKEIRGIMSVSDFEKIAKELANKAEIYTFHVLGDPLKLTNLKAYLDIAKAYKMPLEITTSGFYTKHFNTLLKYENIYQINFSLMANLAQNKISFNDYIKPILSFCKEHLKSEARSFVNLRLWNLNKDFKNAKNAEIYELLEDFFKCKININLTQNRLENRIFLHQARLFKWASLSSNSQNQGFCHALKNQIAILSDGTLVPCCIDTKANINLGNVLKTPFETLLKNPRLIAMKEGFAKGVRVEILCQKCEFFKG